MNEYFIINQHVINDPYIGVGIEKLVELMDVEFYSGSRRVSVDVFTPNYHFIGFSPRENSIMIKGNNFKKAVHDGLFNIRGIEYLFEEDKHTKNTFIILKEDKGSREKCGLSKDSAIGAVLLFHQPCRMRPFNRQTGLLDGQTHIGDNLKPFYLPA